MAMKVKLLGENGQSIGTYHRISKLEYDFDTNQVHIKIDHYANESYREKEKKQKQKIENKKKRYQELFSKKDLTEKEKLEFLALNPQQIESIDIMKTCICSSKYTFFIEDEIELLKDVYKALIEKINIFQNAKEV